MIDIIALCQLLFVLLLLVAAASDLRYRRIPNLIPALIVLLFIVGWLLGFPFTGPWWAHGFHFVAALLVGMLLFRFGWFGGGDAKLYAACALWFSFSDALLLMFVTTASGAVIVLVRALAIVARSIFGSPGAPPDGPRQRRAPRTIPYGIAIAAGGIASLYSVY